MSDPEHTFDGTLHPVGEVVTIMSVNCRECGDDFFGINPRRDAIESTGWRGCKEAAQ